MIRTFKLEDRSYIINSQSQQGIAESVDGFIKRSDSSKEKIWILEIEGEPTGSIFIPGED